MTRHRSPDGTSLVEVLVVGGILSILSLLAYQNFRFHTQTLARQTALNVVQTDLRVWQERMIQDIHRAGFNPTDADPDPFVILAASPTELRFRSDASTPLGTLDPNDPRENLGYRLSSGVLQKWLAGEAWRPILQGVTSLQFTYYDSAGALTNSSPPYAVLTGITAVGVRITVQATTGGYAGAPPPSVSSSFLVTLRNPG